MLLRSWTIDEGHLCAQHGESFRWEYRWLTKYCFKPLFQGKEDRNKILFTCMTATMPIPDMQTFCAQTCVSFPAEQRLWAKADEFNKDHISIELKIGSSTQST